MPGDVLTVIDEVGELDRLGAIRCLCRVLAVDFLAHSPVAVPGLADIGELLDEVGNRLAEFLLDVIQGRRRILHRVMQPGRCNHLLVIADRRDEAGDRLEVHMVGLLVVLASVIDALVGTGRIFTGAFDEIAHGT